MFRHIVLLLLAILTILISCNKDDNSPPPVTPPFAKLNNSNRTFTGYSVTVSYYNPVGDTSWKDTEVHTFYVLSDSLVKMDDTISLYHKHYYKTNHQHPKYNGWILFESTEPYYINQIWFNPNTNTVELRSSLSRPNPANQSTSYYYWEQ